MSKPETAARCRYCEGESVTTVIDLGLSPISNDFRDGETASTSPQTYYPLTALVCQDCWLVQLSSVETPAHFTDTYAYFSSYSQSWLEHSGAFAEAMIRRLGLNAESRVVEIGSNDGYLLQFFKAAGIPVLGVDPSANVANAARKAHDIDTVVEFFGRDCATDLTRKGWTADLIVANNVVAHVPDLSDFVSGFRALLKPGGVISFEFPHLLRLLEESQFDTIYHEHFSYLSLSVLERVLGDQELVVIDVERLDTHGGSLRVLAGHRKDYPGGVQPTATLASVRSDEKEKRLETLETYFDFGRRVVDIKSECLSFLIRARDEGKIVLGYGAPAKGNTFLNFCGVGPELLRYTVDLNPYKQGKYLPGVNIPVKTPDDLLADKPDYVFILPWNLSDEISAQISEIRDWGGKFVVAIPKLKILP